MKVKPGHRTVLNINKNMKNGKKEN